VKNILLGDVWFCSGQSNMAFSLDKDALAATEIPNSANPLIRMLQDEWHTSDTPLEGAKYSGVWLKVITETLL
jgi:sialate O-acetylesterase